jgi:repressor LexA
VARGLTERQRQILEFIKRTVIDSGYQPSIREIGRHFGIRSTRGVVDHLEALQRKGYISRRPDRNRSISLGPKAGLFDGEAVSVPVLGTVTAGQPILAREHLIDQVMVSRDRLPSPDSFFLKIKGDSMVDAHILDGDLALVKPQNEARPGEVVVALIDDEATVKRFYPVDGKIRLQPENESLDPIIIDPERHDFRLIGVVRGVIRWF